MANHNFTQSWSQDWQKNLDNAPSELKDLPLWHDEKSHLILLHLCEKYQVDPRVISELTLWVREQQNKKTKNGRTEAFNEIFSEADYWLKEGK